MGGGGKEGGGGVAGDGAGEAGDGVEVRLPVVLVQSTTRAGRTTRYRPLEATQYREKETDTCRCRETEKN